MRASRRASGEAAFRGAVRRAFLLTAPPALLACALTAVFARPLLETLFGATYREDARLVVLFCIYYALMHVIFVLTAALAARAQTRALFRGSAIAGAVSVVLGWPIVAAWGIEGAAGGMIAGALLVAILFARAYHDLPAGAPAEVDVDGAGTRT